MVSNSEKSVELRKKKKKILEQVMDTETYKIAKEILDRFGDKPQNTPFEVKPKLVDNANFSNASIVIFKIAFASNDGLSMVSIGCPLIRLTT